MRGYLLALAVAGGVVASALAMEPPRPGEIEALARSGKLRQRLEYAYSLGDNLLRVRKTGKAQPMLWSCLPSAGTQRILALLVEFPDHPHTVESGVIDDRLFGDGDPSAYPMESLTRFYNRSSCGLLTLTGDTLGWYTAVYTRDHYTDPAELIQEALDHYDALGHDFTVYDTDGDGEMEYVIVMWTGPSGDWASYWWPSFHFGSSPYPSADGKEVHGFAWVGEPQTTSVRYIIHETGHALGLPDYYDYTTGQGAAGGLGALDIMDRGNTDHNAFSRWILGWTAPVDGGGGPAARTVPATCSAGAEIAVGSRFDGTPWGEYFLIDNRLQSGNDLQLRGEGALILHVDARLDPLFDVETTTTQYDNSSTDHKLLAVVEADADGDIETNPWGSGGEAGDFFSQDNTGSFEPGGLPAPDHHDGTSSLGVVRAVSVPGDPMTMETGTAQGLALLPPVTIRFPADGPGCLHPETTIRWDRVPGASGYALEVRRRETTLLRAELDAGTTAFRVPAGTLAADTVYEVRVKARGDGLSTAAGPFSTVGFAVGCREANIWIPRIPSRLDVPAQLAGFAFDPDTGRSVLYGDWHHFATYEYSGDGWTVIPAPSTGPPLPYPSFRRGPAMAWDPAGQCVLMFGGSDPIAGTNLDDTWCYDPSTHLWHQRSPSLVPPAGGALAYAMASHAAWGIVILHTPGMTYYWNGTDGDWHWLGDWAGTPPNVSLAALAYDAARETIVLFGGYDQSTGTISGETWELDGTGWHQAGSAHTPPARVNALMDYDSRREKVILFGGQAQGEDFDDTWTWDGTDWVRLEICGASPPVRNFPSGGFDGARGRFITTAGVDPPEMWELIPALGGLPGDPDNNGRREARDLALVIRRLDDALLELAGDPDCNGDRVVRTDDLPCIVHWIFH